MDARVLRGWAMISMALAVGLDIGEITKKESMGVIRSRHQVWYERVRKLAANEVYMGHGHHSHRQIAFRWASPFTVGQHSRVGECLILYTVQMGSSQMADEIGNLACKRLLSNTLRKMPGTAVHSSPWYTLCKNG